MLCYTKVPVYILNDGTAALHTLNRINCAWQTVLKGGGEPSSPEAQFEAAQQHIKDINNLSQNIATMIAIVSGK